LAARTRLAALQNSDAHTLTGFVTQSAKRILTRFKMNELTFDGFRMALIDPDARVRTESTVPSAIPRVLGMQVNGGFVDSCTFHFSDNLNCFIGGRGTGKSTALRSLAFGLGINDEFEQHENCPDNVVIYCEDADGVRYRYERLQGHEPAVQAKEDQSITEVPADAFRVEFYGQGELAEVAKDPLKNPTLLQDFLDRHIVLEDLAQREGTLLEELRQSSAQLIPLEATAAQLPAKKGALKEIDKKLQVAEAGRLKEVVALQTRLAAEKSLCVTVGEIQKIYQTGLSLANFKRDYAALVTTAGALTGDAHCEPFLAKLRDSLAAAGAFLDAEQAVINAELKKRAADLNAAVAGLRLRHAVIDQQLNGRIAALQKQGLSGDLRGLNELVRQRTLLQAEISRIEGQAPQLMQLRSARQELLMSLATVRTERMERRKGQLAVINKNLRQTIEDYAINLYYEPSGITDDFLKVVTDGMHGTYFQEDAARQLCSKVTPSELAQLLSSRDVAALEKLVGDAWAAEFLTRFQMLNLLHRLEITSKPPKPIIKVLTKGTAPKPIPVTQLSDGQKHTILLTIAMLAESNLPLVIDQPEDDLDNAFIFKSVVSTLRGIKERRQVIVVTHNANIAVLGDSELILPMRRNGDKGEVVDRGSIDRSETRVAVQNILEGGELAFRKRKEIYGY
jgi:ABC-type cobalamin/Fe3+-siderophores transport system ATPase subunit